MSDEPEAADTDDLGGNQVVYLPERVNFRAADDLAEFLEGLAGLPVVINASDVSYFGAIGLEVLVAGREFWANNGQSFVIESPSDDFLESLSFLGVPDNYFEVEEA